MTIDLTKTAMFFGIAAVLLGCEEKPSFLDGTQPIPVDYIKPRPEDSSITRTNPPSFLWIPESGSEKFELQYSRHWDFKENVTVSVTKLWLNMYTPPEKLEVGEWFWRYRCIFMDGTASHWSPKRQFTVTKDAPELALPTMEGILKRISKERPRLFARPEGLEDFRASRLGERKELWHALEQSIRSRMNQELMQEPVRYPDDKWDVEIWRNYMRQARRMGDTIELMAFGYLAAGDGAYADEAKRWMLHLTTWDPKGPSSWRYNDEVGMPIVLSVSRAYDWIYNALTEDEREKIREMMRIRCGEVYEVLRARPYNVRPFTSHPTRVIKFLGQAAIAFLGEFDEAKEWFEYLVNIFFAIYPPWGDTDGSYSEGPSYWKWYFGWGLQFAHALQTATEIDLHQKPFFRKTGYWALYCKPPYAQMSPFGDAVVTKVDATDKMNLYRLSSVYRDGYLRWYADSVQAELPNNIFRYLWWDDSVKAKPPDDLPSSRAFFDAGYVALHNQLHDGDENIMLVFKSSPYGSQSHAYAEQNSFYLQAFRQPLLISSGYYPWFGSPHHKEWTWHTKAHNSILVNGEGQQTRSAGASGRITKFYASESVDYTVGDATEAYPGKLNRCLRHIVFVRPHYFVIFDDLDATDASTYQWLLHALSQMHIDTSSRTITVSQGNARLQARFVYPTTLAIEQNDQFSVPPENNAPNQWHLTASTVEAQKSGQFLTVLLPYKAGQEGNIPEIANLSQGESIATQVRFNDNADTIAFRPLSTEQISIGSLRTDALVAVMRADKWGCFLECKVVEYENRRLLQSDCPITVFAKKDAEMIEATVDAPKACEIGFGFDKSPRRMQFDEGRAYIRSDEKMVWIKVPKGRSVLKFWM